MRQESPRRGAFWSRPAPAALWAIAVVLVAGAAAQAIGRTSASAGLATGRAQWIWYTSRVPKPAPLRFYAAREFSLTRTPSRAAARLFVDREHVLYVNGELAGAGAQRPGDPVAVYDLSRYLRAGGNRIAIQAASPTGIGGILFAMEIDGRILDAAASGAAWRVDLDPETIRRGGLYRPAVWGPPPQYPWGYPGQSR